MQQANRQTQPYDSFVPVYEGSFEAPIDTEYDLPDYCPDIGRILKCRVTPALSSVLVSGESLLCEGVCDVRVLYLDGRAGALRCCAFSREYSASVPLKGSPADKAVAWVRAGVGHLSCRAVNARRLDLHLAVSLKALAVAQRREEIPCDIREPGVEKRRGSVGAFRAVNALSHRFQTEQDIPLKNGKPPIDQILRQSGTVRVLDVRMGEESLTVSGTIDLSFLYLPTDGEDPEKMGASLDFSQVLVCEGAGEDCVCDLKAELGELSILPREDDLGEFSGVSVSASVFLTAFLYQSCQVDYIEDAYSAAGSLQVLRGESSLLQVVQGLRSESVKKKCRLTSEDGEIEKLLDLWCEQDSVQLSTGPGKLSCVLRFTLCMLFTSGGRVHYKEEIVTQESVFPLDEEADRVQAGCRTEIWEYRIADKNSLEVSVESTLSCFVSRRDTLRYVNAVSPGEDTEEDDGRSCLLLYYGRQGEELWTIAKEHRCLMSDLRRDNGLSEDVLLEDRQLIIVKRGSAR